MKPLNFPIAALLVAMMVVCGAGSASASGSEPETDRRSTGVPAGPITRPATSVRTSATYDALETKGKKIAFTGTAVFVGNEPHASLVVRPEGKDVSYRVLPAEAARDLALVQNRRLAIEALSLDDSGSAESNTVIYMLSWKIVK